MSKTKKRSIFLSIVFSILTSGLGHLYNGKFKKAIFLYSMSVLILLLKIYFLHEFFIGVLLGYFLQIILIFYIIIDCILLSVKSKNYELKVFNKWYLYIAIIILHFIFYRFAGFYVINNLARYQMFQVPTRSNEPTLIMKEKFVLDKWYYKFNKLEKGDIVAFENPDYDPETFPEAKYIIKRCVGIPGDKIEIKNYKLYVNNNLENNYTIKIKSLDERIQSYKEEMKNHKGWIGDLDIKTLENSFKHDDNYINYGPITVKENTFFCLGDNRTNSMDSRIWGLIKEKSLYGKAKYIYWSSNKSKIGKKL